MNPDEIKTGDFVYCDTCEKGFIGERKFVFVKSDHAGHRFRIVSKPKTEEEQAEPENEND